MTSIRPLALTSLAALAVALLPSTVWAQSPNLAGATYLSASVGTGKVGLNCPANTPCSRVDASSVLRAGHRLGNGWAFEVTYSRIAADWGVLGANYSAEFTGFGLGTAYAIPLTDSFSAWARLGGSSNELRLQPAVGLAGRNPGTITTTSFNPYAGLGLVWQISPHWSASANLDVTRADLRESPNAARQGVTVRSVGLGIGFNF
ncbi:outer membrane beta-barrel protein [Roseateles sp. BYS87W]|uniref:Outer membrane beta-barrel protein n=1 Tax=Pelomonas baiyunensis TaxID=3299026 RepID=A0ABW7GWF5_9BURK